MLEVEVKVKTPIKPVEDTLIKMGFERKDAVYELDVYYNGKEKDLKKEDKALRIRQHKDLDTGKSIFLMNFKGPKLDQITMTREETEFEIPSFAHGEIMLKGLDYYPAGKVEKTRTYYGKEDTSVCLDLVTGLGEFIEVEILTEDEAGYDEAIEKIKNLLGCLGVKIEDTIRTSYLSMLGF